MKLFLPAFLFFSFTAFAQNVQHLEADVTVVFSPKVYGYVDGIRLDSIDAVYGEFNRHEGQELYFDYGQKRENKRKLAITDRNGKPLVFIPFTNSLFLNFFNYNGWRLEKVLSTSADPASSFIMMKK